MSGYCSIGSVANPINPKITITTEITVERTGRLINLVNVIIYSMLSLAQSPTFLSCQRNTTLEISLFESLLHLTIVTLYLPQLLGFSYFLCILCLGNGLNLHAIG